MERDKQLSGRQIRLLQEVNDVTNQMREHEAQVILAGERRRDLVSELRDLGVTWRVIAEWAQTTDQALYKHHSRTGRK